MAKETDFENVRSSNFQDFVTLILLTSDRVRDIGYLRASIIDLYLYTKFHMNPQKLFGERGHSPECWKTGVGAESTFEGKTVCPKINRVAPKMAPFFLYALTLPNINRFSKLFHCQDQKKTCYNAVAKDPTTPQVCRYTTLWNVSVIKQQLKTRRLL